MLTIMFLKLYLYYSVNRGMGAKRVMQSNKKITKKGNDITPVLPINLDIVHLR